MKEHSKNGGPRPGAGRPTKYSPTVTSKILAALRNGSTRASACAYAEITVQTFANWLHQYADFSEQVEFAEGKAEVHFTTVLAKAAGKGDWRAAAFWLRTRRRDEWYEHRQVKGEVHLHPTASMTIDEVNQRIHEVYGLDLEPHDDAKPIN